jgi:ribosomal protein L37AE/L43A
MPYFFGFQRFNSARSASIPAASIFAQVAGVSRTVRCTKVSSGGFGGLPLGRFGSSMLRTVAPIYEDSNNPCNPALCDYNKSINWSRTMKLKMTKREHCERCGVTAIFDRNTIRDVWVCRCCGTEKKARVPALVKRLREELEREERKEFACA